MLKLSYAYKRLSVRLSVEGLSSHCPYVNTSKLFIITKWNLDIIGQPRLQGNLTQLVDLIISINEYAVYLISTSTHPFKSSRYLVKIKSQVMTHQILLYSVLGKEIITLELDDSQLIDLVYCLDDFLLDPNIELLFKLPQETSFSNSIEKKEFFYQMISPLLSLLIVSTGIVLGLALPFPKTYNISVKNQGTITAFRS